MKKSIIEKAHDFILKMPSFLEKIVAAILLVGVAYSCIQLGIHVYMTMETRKRIMESLDELRF